MVHVAQQQDAPGLVLDCLRFNEAGIVDGGFGQRVQRLCRQDDLAAVGLDELFVLGQGIHRALVDAPADEAALVQVQRDLVAGGQQRAAQPCSDHTLVSHLGREQQDVAAFSAGDAALIDDRAACTRVGKAVLASHEVVVVQGQCGSHEPPHVDLAGRAEQHAVGVEDEHLPVGVQAAEKLARVAAGDAIERDGGSVRLLEDQ